ncbi:MAG: tetratricopeptide repeat protein [Ferruginibacter sp.]
MLEKKQVDTAPVRNDDVILRAKGFWANYSKPVLYIGGVIILALAGFFGYQNLVKVPKEKKASEVIFPAENLFDKMSTAGFSKDSVNIVLNGGNFEGGSVTGLLKVINNYSGTDAANRATYMAGASYLQIKEFEKAIRYLKEFDGNGASQVQSKAYIMLGHAYAEQKKTDDALSYYRKAVSAVNEKDEALAADALLTAASYAEYLGKSKEAIELYQQLKDKYPTNPTVQGGEVDKHLAKMGILN